MKEALEIMLAELESSRLEVCLAPSKRVKDDYSMIRVLLSKNCDWYRRFCAANQSARGYRRGKFDTCIKRRNTVAALNRMIAGRSGGIYESQLLQHARQFMKGAA